MLGHCIHVAHRQTCRQNTHIRNNKIRGRKEVALRDPDLIVQAAHPQPEKKLVQAGRMFKTQNTPSGKLIYFTVRAGLRRGRAFLGSNVSSNTWY